MKNRLFITIVATIMAITLTGCCAPTDDGQIQELKDRISELEEQLDSAQKPVIDATDSNAPDAPIAEAVTATTTAQDSASSFCDPNLAAYLDQQLASNQYSCWLEVAECPQATVEHLERVAEHCAEINSNRQWAYDIAEAIANNPNTTDYVMSILTDSTFYEVWEIIANAPKSAEEALTATANRCAGIDNNRQYAYDITKAIAKHPNTTDYIMSRLVNSAYYGVWEIVAGAPKSGTKTLTAVAKCCAGIENNRGYAYDIAKAIAGNPNVTDHIMSILTNSTFYGIWEIVANAPKSAEEALTTTAKCCARINNNPQYAYDIAKAISRNPNVTTSSLAPLAASGYSNVSSIGHQTIELLST